MVSRGHDVTIICGSFHHGVTGITTPFFGGRRQADVDGMRVVEFDLNYGNHTNFIRRISLFLKFAIQATKELHRLPRADVVYATSTPITVAIPALWSRIFWRVPFIFEVRDLWPEVPIAMGVLKNKALIALSRWLVKAAYRYCAVCVTLSPGMTKGVRLAEPRAQPVFIPNGADIELFQHDQQSIPQDDILAEWLVDINFSRQKLNFVYAGTMGYANHLELLVDAIAVLNRAHLEKMHFFLIGDGACREAIENRILELKLSDFISVIDPVPKTLLFRALCVFDAGMLLLRDIPDFREGTSPNKFFDYLAAGLPVLVNFKGWISNLLDDGAGLSCASGDRRALSDMIAEFSFKTGDERIFMRAASKTLAMKFDRKDIVIKQCQVCEDAV